MIPSLCLIILFCFMNFNRKNPKLKDEFIKHLYEEEDIDDFALWAFGEDYQSIVLSELYKRWNELHGECYEINPKSSPKNDAIHMVELWRLCR